MSFKKSLSVISVIFFFIYPSLCFPNFLIKLKNGASFVTYRYWDEGQHIKCFRYGGIIGIKKEAVLEIKASDLPYSQGVVSQPEKNESLQVNDKEQSEPNIQKEPLEVSLSLKKIFLEEKERITEKINLTSTDFNLAKEQKDRVKQDSLWKVLLSLQKELSELNSNVEAASGGKLPAWWDEGNKM